MNARIEKRFEEIAAEAVSSAEKVDCRSGDFVEGLQLIIDELRDRKSISEDELARESEDD